MVIIYFYNYHNYNYFHCFCFCLLLRFYIIGCFSTYLTSASDPSRNQWWNLGVPNERLHPLLDWVRFVYLKGSFVSLFTQAAEGHKSYINSLLFEIKRSLWEIQKFKSRGVARGIMFIHPNPYESQTFFERKLTHYLYSHRVLPSSRCVYSKLLVENGRTVL